MQYDKQLWTLVFTLAGTVYIAVGIFYIFCASGEIQPWNGSTKKRKDNTNDKQEESINMTYIQSEQANVN